MASGGRESPEGSSSDSPPRTISRFPRGTDVPRSPGQIKNGAEVRRLTLAADMRMIHKILFSQVGCGLIGLLPALSAP